MHGKQSAAVGTLGTPGQPGTGSAGAVSGRNVCAIIGATEAAHTRTNSAPTHVPGTFTHPQTARTDSKGRPARMGMSVTISTADHSDAEKILKLQYLCYQGE